MEATIKECRVDVVATRSRLKLFYTGFACFILCVLSKFGLTHCFLPFVDTEEIAYSVAASCSVVPRNFRL